MGCSSVGSGGAAAVATQGLGFCGGGAGGTLVVGAFDCDEAVAATTAFFCCWAKRANCLLERPVSSAAFRLASFKKGEVVRARIYVRVFVRQKVIRLKRLPNIPTILYTHLHTQGAHPPVITKRAAPRAPPLRDDYGPVAVDPRLVAVRASPNSVSGTVMGCRPP